MPKVMTNKPYSCPYCTNSYGSENSVYGHVKAKHPGLRYSKSPQSIKVTSTEQTQAERKAKQLIDLKERFMNDEITAETFQETLRSIEKKYKVPVKYVNLDVGRVLNGDKNYLTAYLKDHPHLKSFIRLAQGCDYVALFTAIFNHQIMISDTDTDVEITYMDDGKLVTKECPNSLIIDLYKRVVNGLATTILPQILVSVDDLDEDASLQHSEDAQRSFNDVLASIGMDRRMNIESALIPVMSLFRDKIVVRT